MSKQFIIIESDPVIRMDVEGMLLDQFPSSRVVSGASLSDVGTSLSTSTAESTLIVKGGLLVEHDGLSEAVCNAAVLGCRIVIMGHGADVDFPAVFVQLPFTTDMVLDAMAPIISSDKLTTVD